MVRSLQMTVATGEPLEDEGEAVSSRQKCWWRDREKSARRAGGAWATAVVEATERGRQT